MSRALDVHPAAILSVHAGAIAGALWLAATAGLGPAAAAIAMVLATAPLLLAIRGLREGSRYTQQWVAIAMVFYVGVGLAETIAAQGRSLAAILLLFCCATELLLLLRSLRSGPRASRGSAES
ncbi:MAG TPA: DUF2069 domain-containing protein [Gammaproteobacteria bacterium]|nr:DUF2069 domain-containing protein [Gammaproteobacteria bacterium]